MKISFTGLFCLGWMFMAAGCGQDASFKENVYTDAGKNAEEGPSADATGIDPSLDPNGGNPAANEGPGSDGGILGGPDGILSHISDIAQSMQGKSSSDQVPANAGTISKDQIIAKCQNKEVKVLKQTIVFEEPSQSCEWNKNGNLSQKDGRISARYKQDVFLNLPQNSVVCDLHLDFVEDKSNGQSMYYDDEIFVTYNDVVLAASQSYNDRLMKKDGFLVYDWNHLVGSSYAWDQYEPYCVGEGKGQGECFIPPTQTNGTMKINFSDEVIKDIQVATGVGQSKFSFITTGDNDDPVDCKHSRFQFEVDAYYVVN